MSHTIITVNGIPRIVEFTTLSEAAQRLGLDPAMLVIDRRAHRASRGFYLAILGFSKVVWAQLDDGWFLHGGPRRAAHLAREMILAVEHARDLYDPEAERPETGKIK